MRQGWIRCRTWRRRGPPGDRCRPGTPRASPRRPRAAARRRPRRRPRRSRAPAIRDSATPAGTSQRSCVRSLEVRSARAVGEGAGAGVTPRGVEDDGLAHPQQRLRPAQQLAVGAVGPLRGVDALSRRRRHVRGGRQPGELLADVVAGEDGTAQRLRERPGQGRLPGPRRAADQHQRHPPLPQVAVREVDQRRGAAGHAGVATVRQAGDLGAHERPVGHVVVQQRRGSGVTGQRP